MDWNDIGITVCPGVLKGKARVIHDIEDIDNTEYGEIVVLPNSDPIYAMCVMKASGLICENGGRLSHICVVALEMGLPCITQVPMATKKIRTGDIVFLDAANRMIQVEECD
jgi:pyruvate,water dikinase